VVAVAAFLLQIPGTGCEDYRLHVLALHPTYLAVQLRIRTPCVELRRLQRASPILTLDFDLQEQCTGPSGLTYLNDLLTHLQALFSLTKAVAHHDGNLSQNLAAGTMLDEK
jgi:hypothetical protein